ncbi:MAG: dihydropteroate synthase [Pirellulaceae bacterium]
MDRSPPASDRADRPNILPGYTRGELAVLESLWGVPGGTRPRDLRQLPRHFGQHPQADERLGAYDIDIIAEINHAPRWERPELLATARRLADDGADVIDLGCDPGSIWNGVGEAVRAVRDLGLRVSVDSLSPDEIRAAVNAGAELVLSLNSSNRFLAEELEADWVLIPDEPAGMSGLDETIDFVSSTGQRLRSTDLGADRLGVRREPGR